MCIKDSRFTPFGNLFHNIEMLLFFNSIPLPTSPLPANLQGKLQNSMAGWMRGVLDQEWPSTLSCPAWTFMSCIAVLQNRKVWRHRAIPPPFLICKITIIHTQIPTTSYLGLIWHSTAEATASYSTIEGTLKVRYSFCDRNTVHAVAAAYPQQYFVI